MTKQFHLRSQDDLLKPKPIIWTADMKKKLQELVDADPDIEITDEQKDKEKLREWALSFSEEKAKKEYHHLLEKYRIEMERIKTLESEKQSADVITYFDSYRSTIHDQLKAIGHRLGKIPAIVNLEILSVQDNLEEKGLPEFYLLPLEQASDIHVSVLSPGNNVDTEKNFPEMIIPFLAETSWHLFDERLFFDRTPYTKEQRRRLKIVAEGLGLPIIESHLINTFHNGARFTGIGFTGTDSDRIFSYLLTHRSECSLDPRYMDESTIEQDWEDTIIEVCQEIDEYMRDYEPVRENRTYLIDRWLENLPYTGDIPFFNPERLKKTKEIALEKMREYNISFEVKKENEKIDSEADMSDPYEGYPKHEGMGKRHK